MMKKVKKKLLHQTNEEKKTVSLPYLAYKLSSLVSTAAFSHPVITLFIIVMQNVFLKIEHFALRFC